MTGVQTCALPIFGQGVILGKAEKEFKHFIEKSGMPAAWTILGLSALETDHPQNVGMLGMHGNYGPNVLTNECDVLIAVGMRFDDRVTGRLDKYAKQAKIIHLDIDPAEIDKKVGEAKRVYSEDQDASVAHLMESTGLSANQIFNLPKERLQELVRPGNETDELAVKSISESQDVKTALNKATSLPEAAIYFAAQGDPQLQEQISKNIIPGTNRVNIEGILSQGSIGTRVADFLFNSIVEKEIKKNPGYQKEFEATVPLLINKYPDFGKAYLGNKISQKMEDMGINNSILNVVTEAETDKAVEELQKENKITPNEVQFYKDNLRGEGGIIDVLRGTIGRNYYSTSGAIENLLGAAGRGTLSIGKGASELFGIRKGLLGGTQITARDFSDRDLAVNIAPKGITHEIGRAHV